MLAVPVGLLASAILVVNNVRDLETDRRAGKRTLAVRLGRERARGLYAAMVYGAFLTAPLPWLLGGDGLSPWLLLPFAGAAAGRAGRPDRAQPHRRAVAERRAGRARGCSSSRSARCSPRGCSLAEPMAALCRRAPCGCGCARRCVHGVGRAARARAACGCGCAFAGGDSGEGEAAPLEPYDGVSAGRGAGGARRLRGGRSRRGAGRARRRAAGRLPRRAAAAAGAGGGRPRAVGPGRAAARARRSRRCSARARCGRSGQRDDRRRGPRGRRARRPPRRRRPGSAA